ncbi:hypothetical protein GLYMA_08G355100v4 [Glycine max]|nr:hypothetical protein GLYMA_08G355100v4 [Glycine max]KAH1054659.1 hypothetical protein GYH30_023439 [Glycine max]
MKQVIEMFQSHESDAHSWICFMFVQERHGHHFTFNLKHSLLLLQLHDHGFPNVTLFSTLASFFPMFIFPIVTEQGVFPLSGETHTRLYCLPKSNVLCWLLSSW